MSCNSASSNITGNAIINNVQSVGSRLVTVLTPATGVTGGVESGVTAGDVLYYDVTQSPNLYRRAIADGPDISKAEVVGVVESVSDAGTVLVMSGQINYPEERLNYVDARYENNLTAGACGGNDVFFLTPDGNSAGQVQNLAPQLAGQIAKPVLTRADNGDYNFLVTNYIGYQIGNYVAVEQTDGINALGESSLFVDNGNTFVGDGYIRADESHVLSITEYSDYYNKFGIQYGHVVQVTIDTASVGDITESEIANQTAYQLTNGVTRISGSVSYVSTSVVEIDIKSNGTEEFSTDSKLYINGKSYGKPTAVVLKSVRTPVIIPRSTTTPLVKTANGEIINNSLVYGFKVKSELAVTIPSTVTVSDLVVTNNLQAGSSDSDKTISDLVTVVNNLNTDNVDSRSKLSASPTDNTPYIT